MKKAPSSCSPDQLGATMAQLRTIEDPEQRARAFMQLLSGLMINTCQDAALVRDLIGARLEHASRQ